MTRAASLPPWLAAAEPPVLLGVFLAGYWAFGARVAEPAFAALYAAWSGTVMLWAAWYSPARVHGDPLPQRGLGPARAAFVRTDNLRAALARFGAFAALGAAGLTAFALVRDPGALGRVSWRIFGLKLALYGTWALLQDALLLSFALVRLRAALGEGRGGRAAACAVLALLFAAAHAPNVPLALLSGAAGFAAAWLYWSTPNLLAAALSHAVLGTVLHQVVRLPMRCGPFAARPDLYPSRELLPWLKELLAGCW